MGESQVAVPALVAGVADPGSAKAWDGQPHATAESVRTGEARIAGTRVATIVSDFAVHGGSVGQESAARIIRCVERATAEGLPLLVSPRSGGTRMQEGMAAFVTMIPMTAALRAHKAAGLPFLAYLRGPTTGGSLVSWSALAHVVAAEPRAFIGLLGPKVHRSLGRPAPSAGTQRAETLLARGLLDAVVPRAALRPMLIRTLRALGYGPAAPQSVAAHPPASVPGRSPSVPGRSSHTDAWHAVAVSRAVDRPGVRDLLSHGARDVVYLAGTQASDRHGMVLAFARFGATRAVVVGHARNDRHHLGSEGLRLLQRAVALASDLGLALVTVIDTSGHQLASEEKSGDIAHEIGRCLEGLIAHEGPTVSVILGQGAGAGAIALLPADRTLVAAHGWLSSLPPEAASMVVYDDTAHGAAIAREQGITAADLLDIGVADEIVDDGPCPQPAAREFAHRFTTAIERQLGIAAHISPVRRTRRRARKYRFMLPGGSAAAS